MMKMMSRALIKGTNWMLAVILSMLGFSGCGDKFGQEEYGSPYANFSFHGTVTKKDENSVPVKDIKVEIGLGKEGDINIISNPALTNVSGQYVITLQLYPVEDFRMIVSDIDGETNGSYQNDTIAVKITKDDYFDKGNGNWNRGSADKEVNIVLNEKE